MLENLVVTVMVAFGSHQVLEELWKMVNTWFVYFEQFCFLLYNFLLVTGRVNLPFPAPLSRIESGEALPYMFVGDEAFPLRPYLMRPFPGRSLDNDSRRIFNYRLSRARRVVENAFGKFNSFCELFYVILNLL